MTAKISTGQPSTLATYQTLAKLLFPKALPMIEARIELYGEDEEVVQDERQMLWAMAQIQFKDAPGQPAIIFTKTEIEKAYGG